MKEPKSKYPASLFWTGVALNILQSFLWLAIATVLMLLGGKTPWLGWAGLSLLAAVLIIAVGKQLVYRHTVLHSDSPEFADWQEAMLSPDWNENVKDMVERAMNDRIEIMDEDEIPEETPDEIPDGIPDGAENSEEDGTSDGSDQA
jgi:hypothetical protein